MSHYRVKNGRRGAVDIRIGNVAIDCTEVAPMAEFWKAVLGYETKHADDGDALLRDPSGRNPKLYIQKVPEPRTGKNRLHLDLYAPDEEAEAARIEALGAKRVRKFEEDNDVWILMADPEGNLFCICRGSTENPWG